MATMKITIHEEKNSRFTFHGEKKGPITSHENTLYHPRNTGGVLVNFDNFKNSFESENKL